MRIIEVAVGHALEAECRIGADEATQTDIVNEENHSSYSRDATPYVA